MTHPFFGILLTQSTLVWIALISFAFLLVATLAILFDKKSWREPPHYLLPHRGSVYFAILILSGVLLVGTLLIKIKYFP
jgi:hypothetical protein